MVPAGAASGAADYSRCAADLGPRLLGGIGFDQKYALIVRAAVLLAYALNYSVSYIHCIQSHSATPFLRTDLYKALAGR